MNIFLDSNVLYKDPFLTKGFHKTLNRLSRHEDVTIYISKVVYQEVQRGHKVFLENQIKTAGQALNKLSPYLLNHKDKLIVNIELQDLLNEFEQNYSTLEGNDKLVIIDYDAEVFDHIVEMDMQEKNPFIKKQEIENKGGDIVRFSKKEIRDAIIWYSYLVYITKNSLDDCYFISNNTKEFGDANANKTPDSEPYKLHPELEKNINITPFKTVKDFLIYHDEEVKDLFNEINTLILSEDLSPNIKEELDGGLAEELVNKYFSDEILSYTQEYLSDKQPENIHRDYFMGGYIDPSIDAEVCKIKLNDFEIYGDEITISIDVEVEVDVEIYLYNPVYDNRDEKYQYYATDKVKVEENIVFVIPFDTDREIDEKAFSFEEYITGIEPSNLDIEIIEYTNVKHIDLFPEDYEEENEIAASTD